MLHETSRAKRCCRSQPRSIEQKQSSMTAGWSSEQAFSALAQVSTCFGPGKRCSAPVFGSSPARGGWNGAGKTCITSAFTFSRGGGQLQWTRKKLHRHNRCRHASMPLAERFRKMSRHSNSCHAREQLTHGTAKGNVALLQLLVGQEQAPQTTQQRPAASTASARTANDARTWRIGQLDAIAGRKRVGFVLPEQRKMNLTPFLQASWVTPVHFIRSHWRRSRRTRSTRRASPARHAESSATNVEPPGRSMRNNRHREWPGFRRRQCRPRGP